jgi:excisionase family DNA binding protein
MSDGRSHAAATVSGVSGQPDTAPRYYTVREYAALTRFHPRTIRMKIRSGEIPAENVHGRLRIPAQNLAAPAPKKGAASASPAGDA